MGHNGQHYSACVGERDPYAGEPICAILASNSYLICTTNRGVARGEPILIGIPHRIVEFED